MTLTSELPNSYHPSVVESLEQAFESVWATLYARAATDGDEAKETKIRLSRPLVALAADGITDAKELGSKALENMVLTSR